MKEKRIIGKALLKYGYSNFSLEILEYCDPSKCIEREQYYIDLFEPEYNIFKIAGSSLGLKHTDEAIEKMQLKGIGRITSEATKNQILHPAYGGCKKIQMQQMG